MSIDLINCTDRSCPLLKKDGTGCSVSACIKPQSNVSMMINNATKGKSKKNDMSPADLKKYIIEKQLESARNAHIQASKETDELMKLIQDIYPELKLDSTSTGAKNAKNIKDGILSYIQNGEYNAKSLTKELMEAAKEN